MHFFAFVLILGLLGIVIYLLVIFREVPGAVDERLGVLEELPNLGTWTEDTESEEARAAENRGLMRETRIFQKTVAGLFGGERLVRQVRYRNRSTGAIEEVEADQPFKRRRVKKPGAAAG